MKTNSLQNYEAPPNIILAGLWTSVMFCYVYGDYFELYTPRKVHSLMDNTSTLDSPMKLLFASVLMATPTLMVVLSLTLKPAINQILNIIVGLIFTLIMVLIAVVSFANPWQAFYFLFAIIESTLTSIIVWQALKWPRY